MSDDEEEYNPKAHKQLLQAISSLGKTQHIRRTTRDEPKQQQDEFQLVKGSGAVSAVEARGQPVQIKDIVQVLRGTKKHLDTGKLLRNVQTSKKVLSRPLEKPTAERIRRAIGYEKVKKSLARWDAVVAKNRSAETQIFPLRGETIYVNTSANAQPLQLSLKSDLMRELEATEAKLSALRRERVGDTDDPQDLAKREQEQLKRKLTRDELIARRRELAYLKMRESQKSAKARMQNKIKSKKYHKLLKRQRLQEQIKQFELLQKTNPEAALEKLNALEKSRVLERASLRHKNTGTWAKNLQVRAKYDKDVRKDLAEQLQISRQLTQQKQITESDEEGDDAEVTEPSAKDGPEDEKHDPFNPWTATAGGKAKEQKENEDNPNWRKYWTERNENEKMLAEYHKLLNEEMVDKESPSIVSEEGQEAKVKTGNEGRKQELKEKGEQTISDETNTNLVQPKKKISKKVKIKKKTSKRTKRSKKIKMENGWKVEEIKPTVSKSIDDIFDAQEDRIKRKLSKRLAQLSKQAKKLGKVQSKRMRPKKEKDELKNLNDLSFKNEVKRPIIDEELNNEEFDQKENKEEDVVNKVESKIMESKANTSQPSSDTIDPNQLATVTLKQPHLNGYNALSDAIGDVDIEETEDDPNVEHQMTISQAFEDDDIVADFGKDKSKDSELKDTEIELSMPGWGSWAGAGISPEHTGNRNKRLILKLAETEKRRDENKANVYINEEASKQLRAHLVSDVPFPFTSLKDYEASIRAPIGRNFVPETAFRLLTRPSVITQKGQIIEPMDESELVKPTRRPRNPVDKRIALAAVAAEKAK